MATEFKLPEVSENVDKATVVSVLVAEGDTIKEDQPVIEIETEKATLEVPSSVGGTIKELRVKEGDEINVGDVVLTVDEQPGGEKKDKEKKPAEDQKKEKVEAEKRKQEKAKQEKEKKAETARKKEEEKEEEILGPEKQVKGVSQPEVEGQEEEEAEMTTVAASPSVRRLAREIGVDVSRVKGSGPGGRISVEDVKTFAQQELRERAAGRGVAAPSTPLPDFARYGDVERRSMSSVRRITAERLGYAWATIPHVHQFDKADITELEALRKRRNARVTDDDAKLTMTAIILKVVTNVLKKYPQVNASVDMMEKEIVYKNFYNIGVAVDTDRGLLVPVIHDADQKSIVALAAELNDVARRARAGKLGLDEMKGGTFTITNLGGIGGTNFTPIINPPEVAILGVARAQEEYVIHGGKPEIRLMLPLCLGYDHRVVDGADGARFLRDLAAFLTNPLEFLLEI